MLFRDNFNDTGEGTEKFQALATFQLILLMIGLFANVITLVTLALNGKKFPWITRTLMQHLAVADSLVCLLGIVICTQPVMWMTGNTYLDLLLCQVWHSEAIFWLAILLSIWILVFISVERFVMIEYPFKHRNITPKHIYTALVIMYIVISILMFPVNVLQTRYDDDTGKCLSEYYFDTKAYSDFMSGFGTFVFVTGYAIPMSLFITLYTKAILTIRKRLVKPPSVTFQPSSILNKANLQLTTTAIAVSIVFGICIGYGSCHYMLWRYGIITYEKGSLLSVFGAFLAAINSCANPFIYSASLPIFRKSLRKTFTFQKLVSDGSKSETLRMRRTE